MQFQNADAPSRLASCHARRSVVHDAAPQFLCLGGSLSRGALVDIHNSAARSSRDSRPSRGIAAAFSSLLLWRTRRQKRKDGRSGVISLSALQTQVLDARLCEEIQQELREAQRQIDHLLTTEQLSPVEAEVRVLSSLFPFTPDEVQTEAFSAHASGKDVVCCLPTGSGKTAAGVFAAFRALLRGKRLVYTTPLKALSGQKRREFQRIFGKDAVGLVTGDTSEYPEAPVVVMTTEIFRNMLYRGAETERASSLAPSVTDEVLFQVESVVLDELHWLSDAARGATWEETIIFCPPTLRIVGLSATVGGNVQQLCSWMEEARDLKSHGSSCALVTSTQRAVPVRFYAAGGNALPRLFPLTSAQESDMSAGSSYVGRLEAAGAGEVSSEWMRAFRLRPERVRLARWRTEPVRTLKKLHRLKWLPCIYFIFSRNKCDKQVVALGKFITATKGKGMRWQTIEEQRTIASRLRLLQQDFPEVVFTPPEKYALLAGIASHHAGMLPARRAFVEQLFEDGLLKVIFATETLAAGINMPARSVVLESMEKRAAEGMRFLNGSEFLQMSGRAGRRGFDELGHVVIGTTKSASEADIRSASGALFRGAEPLKSQFFPSFEMICSILSHSPSMSALELKAVVQKSFGSFLRRTSRVADFSSEMDRELLQEDPVFAALQTGAQELRQLRLDIEGAGVAMASLQEYQRLRLTREAQRRINSLSISSYDDDLAELLESALSAPTEIQPDSRLDDGLEFSHELDARDAGEVEGLLEAYEKMKELRQECSQASARLRFELLQMQGSADLWPIFSWQLAVLSHFGFVEVLAAGEDGAPRLEVTPLGAAARRAAGGANVVWLGKALLPEPLGEDLLTSCQLEAAGIAAVVAGMCTEVQGADGGGFGGVDDAGGNRERLQEELQGAVSELEILRWQIAEVQWNCGVVEPLPLSLSAMQSSYAWASGREWRSVVIQATESGKRFDGDVYRMLRRTIEVLRAFAETVRGLGRDEVLPLAERFEEAVKLLDRGPLTQQQKLEQGEELQFSVPASVPTSTS